MRLLIALLISTLLLTACGGDGADTADTTDTAEDTDSAEADAGDGEITDADIEAAIDQAIVEVFCENLDGFDAAFGTFQAAEQGSEEEAAAVDEMAQLGAEIEVLAGEELPELVTALQVIQNAAADYVNGEGDSLTEGEFTESAEIILGADEACGEIGL